MYEDTSLNERKGFTIIPGGVDSIVVILFPTGAVNTRITCLPGISRISPGFNLDLAGNSKDIFASPSVFVRGTPQQAETKAEQSIPASLSLGESFFLYTSYVLYPPGHSLLLILV